MSDRLARIATGSSRTAIFLDQIAIYLRTIAILLSWTSVSRNAVTALGSDPG